MKPFIWKSIAVIVVICLVIGTIISFTTSSDNKESEFFVRQIFRKSYIGVVMLCDTFFWFVAAADNTSFTSYDQNEPVWLKMISRSLTTLDYYEKHLSDMVTDVAVGTRIMEGTFFSPELQT